MKKKVLFICLGNICRSPAAEGIFLHMVKAEGLHDRIHVDSAGTGHWHIGENPDPRMIAHAAKRGYDLSALEARQFSETDFNEFDHILTMDDSNLHNVLALDRKKEHRHKVQPITEYCRIHSLKEVPDPYYKGDDGFEHVLDLLEDACGELLKKLKGAR